MRELIGKQIVVYVDPDVEYRGEIVGGLRVRAARKPGPSKANADAVGSGQTIDDSDVPF